jgi:anti-sigma B factor antagonist
MTGDGTGIIAARETMQHVDDAYEPTRVDALGIKPPPAYAMEGSTAGAGISLLLLSGELDLAAVSSLRAHTDGADVRGLVIDLADVTFMDSSALRELLHAQLEADRRGARLVLVGVPANVRRVLEITGTVEIFDIAESHEAALARFGG